MEQELAANARQLIQGFPFSGETPADRVLQLIQPVTSLRAPLPNVVDEYDVEMDGIEVDMTDTPDVPL
jgi:hypothetical protein